MTFNSQLKSLWFFCLPADDVTADLSARSPGAGWGIPEDVMMLVLWSDFGRRGCKPICCCYLL